MNKQDVLAALDQDRLFLLLQPVVSTQTHRSVFYEALLRMRADTGAVIPPADFILTAEQNNYVHDIDRRALQLAIRLLERYPAFDLSMNISSLTTVDFSWVRALDELTADRRGLTHRLIVEVTETAAIEDVNRTLLFIDALKDLGCRVAIDDFGAGHTNIENLHLFTPQIVKLDQSLVDRCAEPAGRASLDEVMSLSHKLGFETVAEGVQSEACVEAMTQIGVTYLQGFLFGEPLPPDAALAQSQAR